MEDYKISKDCTGIDLQAAKFIFHQSEKLLEALISTTNFLINRGTTNLQIIITLFLANMGYIIASLNNGYNVHFFVMAIMLLITLSFSGYFSLRMMYLASVNEIGSRPRLLINKELVQYDCDNQELVFVLNEIQNYEDRIESNMALNEKRAHFFRWTMYSFGIGILLILTYLSLTLLC